DHRSRIDVISVTRIDAGPSKLLSEGCVAPSAGPDRGRLERIETLWITGRQKPEAGVDDPCSPVWEREARIGRVIPGTAAVHTRHGRTAGRDHGRQDLLQAVVTEQIADLSCASGMTS